MLLYTNDALYTIFLANLIPLFSDFQFLSICINIYVCSFQFFVPYKYFHLFGSMFILRTYYFIFLFPFSLPPLDHSLYPYLLVLYPRFLSLCFKSLFSLYYLILQFHMSSSSSFSLAFVPSHVVAGFNSIRNSSYFSFSSVPLVPYFFVNSLTILIIEIKGK